MRSYCSLNPTMFDDEKEASMKGRDLEKERTYSMLALSEAISNMTSLH